MKHGKVVIVNLKHVLIATGNHCSKKDVGTQKGNLAARLADAALVGGGAPTMRSPCLLQELDPEGTRWSTRAVVCTQILG